MHPVNSAVFNDWQARLTMLSSAALSGDKGAILGCYRLLAGRESAIATGGLVTREIEMRVREALGLPCCVPAFLSAERKSVISPRSRIGSHEEVLWTLEGNGRKQLELRGTVYSPLLTSGIFAAEDAVTGHTLRATRNGVPLLTLCAGDVVQIVIYRAF